MFLIVFAKQVKWEALIFQFKLKQDEIRQHFIQTIPVNILENEIL